MKFIPFTLLLLLAQSLSAMPKEYVPDFQLNSTEKDPSLGEKSVFFIHFEGLPHNVKAVHILWQIDDNGTARATLTPERTMEIETSEGEHSFQFFYDSGFSEIETHKVHIKAGYRDTYTASFRKAKEIQTIEKPVIYLYPEERMQVEVKVQTEGKMLFTYPPLKDSWKMTANPDGALEIDGKSYPYLFWEAEQQRMQADWREGAVVEKEQVVEFLEAQLDQVGLNAKERTDFITYWAPRMMQHPRCVVHFLQNNDCAQFADLNVLPQPDEINRLYILWTGVDNFADYSYLRPQKLQKISRLGFNVLEWGGVEITEYPVKIEEL